MMRAVFNGETIAESSETVVVEGNHYFPAASLNMNYFEKIDATTFCPWKGHASYYTVRVADKVSEGAAWYYQSPKEAAAEIKDHVAFWRGVEVLE
jgi:uncharacterized protein (DUF427 family)